MGHKTKWDLLTTNPPGGDHLLKTNLAVCTGLWSFNQL